MTCILYRRLFQDSMEILLQMALFSEDFVLSKTRFSLLIFFFIISKNCLILVFFYINCNALAISKEL